MKSSAARVAGMDGSQTERVVAYVSRLVGQPVAADQRLMLRSVQRASLASWLRNEQIPVRGSLAGSAALGIVINELLSGEMNAQTASSVPNPGLARRPQPVGALAGIGIDIEQIDRLPDADDYREHPFYRDTFAPTEIAYCLQQRDVKASFAGMWAAKEAIVKSGLPGRSMDDLKSIEVWHDGHGRPNHGGCILSISHTDTTAVAVCVVVAAAPEPNLKAPTTPRQNDGAAARDSRHHLSKWTIPTLLTLVVALAGVACLLYRFA